MVVARRRTPRRRSGRCATSRCGPSRARRSGSSGRNGSGKTTLLKLVSGIFKPTSGRIEAGGPDRLAARARRRLPPRLHRPRERLPERLDPRPLARADPRADGRDRRLRRARALHRPAGADVFVGDVHAARLLRRRPHPGRRAAARRGVRRRRRGLPAQVLREDPRVQAARRHDRLRLARRAGGRAALRPGGAAPAGRRRFDGDDARGDRALPAAARGRRAAPTSSPPGCASGEAARRGSSPPGCSTPTATSGVQFARRRAVSSSSCASPPTSATSPPRSVSLELRDDDGVALGGVTPADRRARLGRRGAGERELRFELDRLPLAEGRFHLRCALVDGDGGRLLHSLDDAVRFLVFPTGGETGRRAARGPLVDAGDRRLRANRTRDELAQPAPTGRS